MNASIASNWTRSFVVVAIAFFAIAGCCTRQIVGSPKKQFFLINPEQTTKFIELSEASIAVLRADADATLRSKLAILNGARTAVAEQRDLAQFFEAVEKNLREDYRGQIELIQEMDSSFDDERDSLFYYSFRDNKVEEQGWAILRDGQMRMKFPLATTPVSR